MHEYYKKNTQRLESEMDNYFKFIKQELEGIFGEPYEQVKAEIWKIYETEMLENFPYIGGDDVSGTGNLTGVYFFIALALATKPYGVSTDEWGRLTTTCYERFNTQKPAFVRKIAGSMMKACGTKMLRKKDAKNAANAAKYPGSFETQTMEADSIYAVNFHNLVCPVYNFAVERGYEEYMPYMCNLDYVTYGAMGLAMRREKVLADGDDCCDFKFLRKGEPAANWPPHILDKNDPLK